METRYAKQTDGIECAAWDHWNVKANGKLPRKTESDLYRNPGSQLTSGRQITAALHVFSGLCRGETHSEMPNALKVPKHRRPQRQENRRNGENVIAP
ncbi:hypothetical protein [Mycoplana ramosa]|uniref:Uncharacterized protein n=1 Tax=Mycoplana ramosa TaxID=40837 RepID=A0ABW3YRL8_MYCRA